MKNKKVLLIAIGSLLLIAVGISISYAYYLATVSQQGENIVKTDCFQLTYEDEGEVTLSNTFPIRDSEVNTITPYHFKIKNVCNLPAAYQVNLEVLNNSTLDIQYLNYKLDNGGVTALSTVDSETPTVSGATISKKLVTGNLLAGEEKEYDLRVFLKESVTTNDPVQNKTFKSKVVVISTLNKDLIPKNRNAVMSALTKFDENDLKEVVMCDDNGTEDSPNYVNCSIYNTIDEAIADRNTGTIILTKDITRNNIITIAANKNYVLELNGKKIETINPNDLEETSTTWNKNYVALDIYGNLVINDLNNLGKVISYIAGDCIYVEETGNLVINGGTYNGRRSMENFGNVIINGGNFNTKLYNIISINQENSNLVINNGDFDMNINSSSSSISSSNGNITINNGNFDGYSSVINNNDTNGIITINGGYFESETASATINSSTGTLNINGGTFVSNSSIAVYNSSTGTININQTNKPMYISSLAQEWKPAIKNTSTGSINITASQANRCTANSSDTTSGLCVYAEGNKNYSENTSNGALQNYGGIVNIDGGTYYGGFQGLNNGTTGTLNIKNAKVISSRVALLNNSTGTINVCSSNINGTSADSVNINGTVNYNNVTFSNGTTTPDSSKITGTITSSSTCPIS